MLTAKGRKLATALLVASASDFEQLMKAAAWKLCLKNTTLMDSSTNLHEYINWIQIIKSWLAYLCTFVSIRGYSSFLQLIIIHAKV